MESNYSIFLSRTFWTAVAMFFVGGLNAIMPVLTAGLQAGVMAVLAVAATYFHINPTQQYNQPE